MQRAQSAVDFSSLLNPDSSSSSSSDSLDQQVRLQNKAMPNSKAQHEQEQADQHDEAADVDMDSSESTSPVVASASTIRPNGPVPNGQTAEPGAPEMPRPYKCPLCDKAFHRLEHQTRHIRTHTGEKPHACQFPGCSKRFSRSDELTRHSRIHNNPNSRRHNKASHMPHTSYNPGADGLMPSSIGAKAIRSAPPSALASPSHSPPHSYSSYSLANGLKPSFLGASSGSSRLGGASTGYGGSTSPQQLHQNAGMDIAMLAKAAHQVERETLMGPPSHFSSPSASRHQSHGSIGSMFGNANGVSSSSNGAGAGPSSSSSSHYPSYAPHYGSQQSTQHHHHHHHHHHQPTTASPPSYYAHSAHSSRGHLPSLSAYHMSRSNSHEDGHHQQQQQPGGGSGGSSGDEHYNMHGFRHVKRSRPSSPNSTAPSSPTFSHDSLSPTPDHTPLATPAHSPRLRPYELQLPPFRQLPHTTPALAPLEPQLDAAKYTQPAMAGSGSGGMGSKTSSGISLSDILSRPEGTQRKLPVPQIMSKTVSEMLMPGEGFNLSGRSSSANSLAGGDLLERM